MPKDKTSQGSSPALEVIAAVFGLFAGIATIVYVGGASLLALRLLFAGMPTPAVFASQISRELVTSIGLTQILLPLLVVALIYLAFRILLGSAERTLIHGWWRWLVWTLIGMAILVVPGYWYHLAWHHSHPNQTRISWPWWWTGLVFIIPAVTVLVALRIRQRLLTGTYKTRWTFNAPKALLTMAALWALAALPGALILGSATPFERVAVCSHGEEIGGLFVGQSSDRVYVGEDVESVASIERRIVSLSFDKTDAVFVGGREGDCDHPAILPAELRTGSPEVVGDT